MLGGVCVNTGTIPSKTLREAVLYLTGMSQRELYGASYRVKEKITPADLLARTQHVIGKEIDVVRNQLMRNRRRALRRPRPASSTNTPSRSRTPAAPNASPSAAATSSSPPAPRRHGPPASSSTRTGCSTPTASSTSSPSPARWSSSAPASSASSTRRCSPRSAPRSPWSRSATRCWSSATPRSSRRCSFHLRDLAVTFRFGEEVTGVDVGSAGHRHHPGQRQADPGRDGHVLGGPPGPDRRTSTWPTPAWRPTTAAGSSSTTDFQTKVDHIYAVGDVIGFPALAATSMDQGRLAAYHAFGEPTARA